MKSSSLIIAGSSWHCWALALLACALLAGCGFQLPGKQQLNISTVAVIAPIGKTDLRYALVKHLRRQGTNVQVAMDANDREAAKRRELLVEILDERVYFRPVSTNIFVEAADYELRKEVDIAISVNGKTITPNSTLATERVYAVDPLNLNASHEEQSLHLAEMDIELAEKLQRRLEAVARIN